MIRELIESLKYVGHYFAIFFLRLFVGFHILNLGLSKLYAGYTTEPLIAAQINEFLNVGFNPVGIDYLFLELVRPYWSFFSSLIVGLEIITGLLLIFGFLVRPTAVILIIFIFIFSFIQNPYLISWSSLMTASLFCLGWAGAGRCLGIDYYFYKRYRGFLW